MNWSEQVASVEDFDRAFSTVFGQGAFESLAVPPLPRIRLDMGGDVPRAQRRDAMVERCELLLRYVFRRSSIWVRIVPESHGSEHLLSELGRLGYEVHPKGSFESVVDGEQVLLHRSGYLRSSAISPLIYTIVSYELGLGTGMYIRCRFVSLDNGIVATLHGDRVVDVVSVSRETVRDIERTFSTFTFSVANV